MKSQLIVVYSPLNIVLLLAADTVIDQLVNIVEQLAALEISCFRYFPKNRDNWTFPRWPETRLQMKANAEWHHRHINFKVDIYCRFNYWSRTG